MVSTLRGGIMQVPVPPSSRQQLVAVKDIGEIVARAFENPRKAIGKTVELAGDEVAFGDLPAALSQKLGHPITYAGNRRKRRGRSWRRRTSDVPVFQDERVPRRHRRLETAWGYRMILFQGVPRHGRLGASADQVVRGHFSRGRVGRRSFRAAACGSRRRAATSSASASKARPNRETIRHASGEESLARSRGSRVGPGQPHAWPEIRSGPDRPHAGRGRPRVRRCRDLPSRVSG